MTNSSSPALIESNCSAERPILGLLDGLPTVEIERTAIDVIQANRRLVDEAENLFGRLQEAEGEPSADREELLRAYRLAMMRVHGFQTVVECVLDALGYVPNVHPKT